MREENDMRHDQRLGVKNKERKSLDKWGKLKLEIKK